MAPWVAFASAAKRAASGGWGEESRTSFGHLGLPDLRRRRVVVLEQHDGHRRRRLGALFALGLELLARGWGRRLAGVRVAAVLLLVVRLVAAVRLLILRLVAAVSLLILRLGAAVRL